MSLCARCGVVITGEEGCDYHESDCVNDGTGACWCDTRQRLHHRCCLKCKPLEVVA